MKKLLMYAAPSAKQKLPLHRVVEIFAASSSYWGSAWQRRWHDLLSAMLFFFFFFIENLVVHSNFQSCPLNCLYFNFDPHSFKNFIFIFDLFVEFLFIFISSFNPNLLCIVVSNLVLILLIFNFFS